MTVPSLSHVSPGCSGISCNMGIHPPDAHPCGGSWPAQRVWLWEPAHLGSKFCFTIQQPHLRKETEFTG